MSEQEQCTHLDRVQVLDVPSKDAVAGCEECLKIGGQWVHLRVCLTCGHVGCCDSSPHKHATAHHRATGNPIITSGEIGETWAYCYPDDRFLSAQ